MDPQLQIIETNNYNNKSLVIDRTPTANIVK